MEDQLFSRVNVKMELVYQMMIMQAVTGVFAMIVFFNWRGNLNFIKMKLFTNHCILRFKSPSRREEEIVVKLTEPVYKRKVGGKKIEKYVYEVVNKNDNKI